MQLTLRGRGNEERGTAIFIDQSFRFFNQNINIIVKSFCHKIRIWKGLDARVPFTTAREATFWPLDLFYPLGAHYCAEVGYPFLAASVVLSQKLAPYSSSIWWSYIPENTSKISLLRVYNQLSNYYNLFNNPVWAFTWAKWNWSVV